MSNWTNKTDEELRDYLSYRERDLVKAEAKIRLFGKILGEDKIDNITSMIQVMYDDYCTYDYYSRERDELYEELERRAQDNAEDN